MTCLLQIFTACYHFFKKKKGITVPEPTLQETGCESGLTWKVAISGIHHGLDEKAWIKVSPLSNTGMH